MSKFNSAKTAISNFTILDELIITLKEFISISSESFFDYEILKLEERMEERDAGVTRS